MGTDALTERGLFLSFEGPDGERPAVERLVADILARDTLGVMIGGGAGTDGVTFDIEVDALDPDRLVARIEAALLDRPETTLVAAVLVED